MLSNVISIKGMFKECHELSILPDISKWNTQSVEDMSFLFYECKSLRALPDISKWVTSNVVDMSFMFFGFSSPFSLRKFRFLQI